jgi:hypothetical protein
VLLGKAQAISSWLGKYLTLEGRKEKKNKVKLFVNYLSWALANGLGRGI